MINISSHEKDTSCHVLDENDVFKLINKYEDAYLTNKLTGEEIFLGNFYGDPECGIIGADNSFCFVGGNYCILYRDGKIIEVDDVRLNWILRVRQMSDKSIEILTDPWRVDSALWQLNIEDLSILKIRNFADYIDKDYTDNIIW